jgi:hypothetical protein
MAKAKPAVKKKTAKPAKKAAAKKTVSKKKTAVKKKAVPRKKAAAARGTALAAAGVLEASCGKGKRCIMDEDEGGFIRQNFINGRWVQVGGTVFPTLEACITALSQYA